MADPRRRKLDSMKYLVIFIALLIHSTSYSQITDTLKVKPLPASEIVSFIAKVDTAFATRDGIYLNGYVVNMDYGEIKRLHGKTIKVTGVVTLVKGLKNQPKELDKDGQEILKGGRP